MERTHHRFEIEFLDEYTEESLLSEIRRVAAKFDGEFLSEKMFEHLSRRVSASTVRRKLGGWKEALSAAGFGHLYGGRTVSEKMKLQSAKRLSNDDLISEMKRVQTKFGSGQLTTVDFDRHSTITCSAAVRNRFGSWKTALEKAGIPQSKMANKRWTDEQCFENLAAVWTQLGRQPNYGEMSQPPSMINSKAYETRWGTWRKALRAFVAWANADSENRAQGWPESAEPAAKSVEVTATRTEPHRRQVSPRLRFRVLQRDHFKCIACGRSPATHLNVVLHADHVLPFAHGGKTVVENLQTLCQDCNLGKGTSPACSRPQAL